MKSKQPLQGNGLIMRNQKKYLQWALLPILFVAFILFATNIVIYLLDFKRNTRIVSPFLVEKIGCSPKDSIP